MKKLKPLPPEILEHLFASIFYLTKNKKDKVSKDIRNTTIKIVDYLSK